ncbi:hypothetical protein Aab01nite_13010 [Paractinoplanes abujensis]|uniref:Pyridoxamine 5'-phosphate oxidase N-terminal domain-containing protein n=1 Tax=Paractinoplanes abujensis TaxID=882441 RepID=A0A7W7FZT0_9ACTN|nr:pyridoxamine 5'-phosphate oxidase family protein [Actinoplanes abujensis]MBB4690877.1 hypothetical protein [Actinoplanes abujensis]GID17711.1 hypothetical protein Aab01nite_13010 [Actinoplanes abujensis]
MSEPVGDLHPGLSSPGAAARPWSDVDGKLTRPKTFWLSTAHADGRPHVTPLPAAWTAGSSHFCTGPSEQKAKNLEANPYVVLTTGSTRASASPRGNREGGSWSSAASASTT